MRRQYSLWALWVCAMATLPACVSSSKYKALEAEHAAALQREATLKKSEADYAKKLKEAEARIANLEMNIANLQGAVSSKQASAAELERALEELRKRKAESDKRVQEYRDLLARFKTLIDAGKLEVKIVDGRMVVALPTDILFDSGKATLSPEGRTALLEVAQLLSSIPDKKYQVEGHTDSQPIRTAQYPSNWELAAARAIIVVKTMIEGGLSPERVSAASFAEFKPVADNSTKETRAKNRRIEIVILPDLSQLPGFDELSKL